ncbi:MAG: hypothetical protein LBC41_12365 [Clostridiales bacterium]|jgi:CRISPR-associated protein Csx10|nr:hypothetical protein [Clostridiales bacterium]MDR2751445.1 hypothetical protein [Clostridiales bacterium]
MRIKLDLKSDMCSYGGDGFAGVVDMDIVYDIDGLPFIPSKRLKGLLRESAIEILDYDPSFQATNDALFGESGKIQGGSLKLGNGRLLDQTPGKDHTSLRTRTAMENGQAKNGSLRVMRVVKKGESFVFDVECDSSHRKFLEMCCKGMRHLGLNRTRGLGEVACTIEDTGVEPSAKFDLSEGVLIELLEPVIVADRAGKPLECEYYLPGTLLCGYFASRYAKVHGENADYRRMFLQGEVSFTAAFPTDSDGTVYHHAPLSLRVSKDKISAAENSSNPKFSKPLGGFINDGTPLSVSLEVFAHHARPADRSIGKASESEGEFYAYKALSRGQKFVCRINGSKNDLKAISSLLEPTVHLGRSRTAQYGTAKISATKAVLPKPLQVPAGGKFRAIVQTPLILVDDQGTNRPDPSLLNIGEGFEVSKVVLTETVVAGYVAKWLLPRQQARAIAEGSVIEFVNSGKARSVNAAGFYGLRTNEGFGELRFEEIPKSAEQTLKESVTSTRVLLSTQGSRDQELKLKGMTYAKSVKHNNSSVARILVMLAKCKSFLEFARELDKFEQPDAKQAAVLLCIGTKSKLEVMTGDFKKIFEEEAKSTSGAENFDSYKIWLRAALTQIKYNNRNKKGGASDGN